jgi:hypothetical protein
MLASEFWFQLVVVLILKETFMSLELFVPKYFNRNLPASCGLCVFIHMYISHLSVYTMTVKIPLTLGCVSPLSEYSVFCQNPWAYVYDFVLQFHIHWYLLCPGNQI